jgi:hypothetical protein
MKRIFTSLILSVLALILAGCGLENLGVTFTCVDWTLNTDGGGIIHIPSEEPPSESETVSIEFRVTDGDGTTLSSFTFDEEEDGEAFMKSLSDGDSIPYAVLPTSNPLTFEMYVILDGTPMLLFEDSGSCSGLGGDENIVYPPDDRINWQYGDLDVVVYSHSEGTVVYCYRDGAWLGMLINQAVVDNAPTGQAQHIPVLEAEGCNAAFYILDSGEYQINVWTNEGKLYELISDTLDFTNATKRYYDPNE